jgi:hypothetical protein
MLLKLRSLLLCSWIFLSACSDYFSARQQVFECFKVSLDGEPLANPTRDVRYFHFNDERLNISVGAVGIGLSEYQCKKTEFVYHCIDNRKDNVDDQITLDRFTLQAQQTLYNTSKTTIIDYSCGQLERKVD